MGALPAVFVSLAACEEVPADLAAWASALPQPRAILSVSPFWHAPSLSRGTTVARPSATYSAPGAAALAYDLHALLPVDREERGWDEGVLRPLRTLFPAAEVPVLQLSLVAGASPRRLFGIGRKLGALADRGVLVVGAGIIGRDPAFDGWVANALADADIEPLLQWRALGPSARDAVAMEALFVVAGVASICDHAVGFPVRGFSARGDSLRCVQLGR